MCFSLIPKKQSILLGVVVCIFTSIPAISLAMEDAPQLQKGHVAAVKAFLDHLTDNAGPIQPGVKEAWTKPYTALPINSNVDSTSTVYVKPSHTLALKKDASPMKYPIGSPRYGPSSNFEGGGPSIERGSSHGLPSLSTSKSDPLLKIFLEEFTHRLEPIDSSTPTDMQKLKHPSYNIAMYFNDKTQFIRILNPEELIQPSDELEIRYWELIQSIHGLKVQEFSKPEGQRIKLPPDVYYPSIFNWLNDQIFSPDKSLPICGFPHLRLTEREFARAKLGEIQGKMLDYWHGSRSSNELASVLVMAYDKHLENWRSTYKSGIGMHGHHYVPLNSPSLKLMHSDLWNLDQKNIEVKESEVKDSLQLFRSLCGFFWDRTAREVNRDSLQVEHPILPIGISSSKHVNILKSQIGQPIGQDVVIKTVEELFVSATLLHLKFSKSFPKELARRATLSDLTSFFFVEFVSIKPDGLPMVGEILREFEDWSLHTVSYPQIHLIQHISGSQNQPFIGLDRLKAYILTMFYHQIFSKEELIELSSLNIAS